MSIRVDLSAPEVDRQVELLREYPEIAERHYKPALQRSVRALADMVEPNIPVRTGRARSTFGSKVVGRGTSIRGEVGWYRSGAPFYIRFSEGGAAPHEISARGGNVTLVRYLAGAKGANVIRFPGPGQGSEFTFVRGSVRHPGTSARGFMQSAWRATQPMIEQAIRLANEAVVRDLALP